MDLKRTGIRFGIFAGILTVLVSIGAYWINKELYFSTWPSVIMWIIYLYCMRQASIDTRRIYLSQVDVTEQPYHFSLALQAPFLVYLIANAFYYLQYYAMFNWIDPGMTQVAQDIAVSTLTSMDNYLGSFLDQDKLDMMIEAAQNSDYSVTLGSTLFNLASGLIGGFLISCIFALVFRTAK